MVPPSCRRWWHVARWHHTSRREPVRQVGFRPLTGRFGDEQAKRLTNPGAEGAPWQARRPWLGGPRDTFVVPSWVSHHHVARVETVLFSFSDRPVQEKFGLWRQGRGNH